MLELETRKTSIPEKQKWKMGSRFGEPKSKFKMKILENQTVLIFEPGDIDKFSPGKGSTINFLFIPKEDETKFKQSEIRWCLIPCLSYPEGRIIYY